MTLDFSSQLERLIDVALHEDIPQGDITTDLMIATQQRASGQLLAKQDGVFYGHAILCRLPLAVDPTLDITVNISDGDAFSAGQQLAHFSGPLQAILKFERVSLNLLQRLCGIATQTAAYVTTLNNPAIEILDTRKTTPGLRFLEKRAVLAGGGHAHRWGLSDMILIKENHLAVWKTDNKLSALGEHLKQQKLSAPNIPIEIEIDHLDLLYALDLSAVDFILFDNFEIPNLLTAINHCNTKGYKAKYEVSGNITLDTITRYTHTPIHRISVGALTHSVSAVDLSLLVD